MRSAHAASTPDLPAARHQRADGGADRGGCGEQQDHEPGAIVARCPHDRRCGGSGAAADGPGDVRDGTRDAELRPPAGGARARAPATMSARRRRSCCRAGSTSRPRTPRRTVRARRAFRRRRGRRPLPTGEAAAAPPRRLRAVRRARVPCSPSRPARGRGRHGRRSHRSGDGPSRERDRTAGDGGPHARRDRARRGRRDLGAPSADRAPLARAVCLHHLEVPSLARRRAVTRLRGRGGRAAQRVRGSRGCGRPLAAGRRLRVSRLGGLGDGRDGGVAPCAARRRLSLLHASAAWSRA